MKIFHTADWHLGKLIQGIYMTEEQRYALQQFIDAIKTEKPDAVIIAGDLYDRAVPPTDAVNLLDELLAKIVLELETPVLAVAGNHDSPGRLNFGSRLMKDKGIHIAGHVQKDPQPVVLEDEHGEVHFHLVPYTDPSMVRYIFDDPAIRTHDDALQAITANIKSNWKRSARHVFVGHAFVTSHGEQEDNTSDSERPLAIGGAEHVSAAHLEDFHYSALGHLHKAHFVRNETIRYSGSPLKYSISEEHHQKGYLVVELDADGNATVEKRLLEPRRNMRRVEGTIDEILRREVSEDFVFVTLLDDAPVLFPMEKVRSVYPNAMHVERKNFIREKAESNGQSRQKMDSLSLFHAFYEEVKGEAASDETAAIFEEVLQEFLQEEPAEKEEVKA
ncbi:exonuclease SbcCD subunit D [Planococcus halotolerans]|uniref:Nuclease SbcCD subunit D n=1 Tax=Planococcus halotolerans TaxID=2233542 RepID=A0A365KR47_9BACL|nr:exonuclease SbcCD subunit D [Planococcus halotolerans]QHJ69407.1 exonuclease subunit SbcD [Planococcus halotolerans]RAZ75610.1 exonuclease SbcCD subunit D [Planococcus halotolerans]